MNKPTTAESGKGPVLVATDFSGPSDEALRQAHERATADGAQLVVCHVVPSLLPVSMLFPQRAVEHGNAQLSLQQRAAELLVERTHAITGRSPSEYGAVVLEGSPYGAIVEHAEQVGAELIVVGDHGTTGVGRLVLGSVAERVLRFAHCPVLVARAGRRTKRILVATDLSDPSLPALSTASAEARRTGWPVTALHCVEFAAPVLGPEYGVVYTPALAPTIAEEMRAAASSRLTDAVREIGIEADVRVADAPAAAATTIASVALELDADLVVIGTRGRTGLRRVALGSVAEAVVRNTKSSVLVVRLKDDARV
jgi:nucleotide-binding universal stress UspA family protein